jgi:hypothetical protein
MPKNWSGSKKKGKTNCKQKDRSGEDQFETYTVPPAKNYREIYTYNSLCVYVHR